jgi:V/A-type H+/Na+-transporting ATPase subunit E
MAQEIKDLIAKIQQEGIQAAQSLAAQIKSDADKEVLKIISGAKNQAQKIIEQAESQAQKTDAATRATLEQAGRDMLITLRQEIISMLERLIKIDLRQALSVEEMSKIITALIKDAPLTLGSQIVVTLNSSDKDKLEQSLLKQLIAETKKTIILKSLDTIDSGFIISFDAAKSIFDFSSQALSDYICGCLKPELSRILNSK